MADGQCDALQEKLNELAAACRRNDYTQPVTLKLTVSEIFRLQKLVDFDETKSKKKLPNS